MVFQQVILVYKIQYIHTYTNDRKTVRSYNTEYTDQYIDCKTNTLKGRKRWYS